MLRNLTVLSSLPSVSRFASEMICAVPPDGASLEHTDVHLLETPKHAIYWSGFIYADGRSSGINSVQRFAEALANGLLEALNCLKGVYMLVVADKVSGDAYAFVDSSGLFHAFYSSRGVSSSFLKLAAQHGSDLPELSPDALVQFFHFGHVPFGGTFFREINRLDGDQIVRISSAGAVSLMSKNSRALGPEPARDFATQLMSFATSVAAEKVSIDLTGGIDSRLLAVILEYFGLPFELAVSGADDHEDVTIAREVAKILNRPLNVNHHESGDFEGSLPALFEACDGLFNVASGHGPLQNQRKRKARGATLMITGAGGELFKDFWWLQDFPFYRQRTSHIGRLYSMRIVPVAPRHDYFAEPYANVSRCLRRTYLQRLAGYASPTNTQTYDRIYYYVKMRDVVGRMMSNHAWLLHCYAPYLEPEIATVGYRLPRSMRFFNSFHRQMTTRYCPAAARIHTTEGGMSVSSEPGAIAVDLAKYVINRVSRLDRKIGQTIFRRRGLERGPTNPAFEHDLQRYAATKRGFERLKDAGILRSDLALADVPPQYCGNVLSLGMFLDWVEGARKLTNPRESTRFEYVLSGLIKSGSSSVGARA
jgi:hypothetical protein